MSTCGIDTQAKIEKVFLSMADIVKEKNKRYGDSALMPRRIFSKLPESVSKAAHPDMRRIMVPLYNDCRAVCPEIFNLGDPE
jgi:hypothetical protein